MTNLTPCDANPVSAEGCPASPGPSATANACGGPDLDLPRGFASQADGILHAVNTPEGNCEWVPLCSPLAVVGLIRTADGTGWGKVVDVTDPDGDTHRWILDAAHLASSPKSVLAPLYDRGLRVVPGKENDARVVALIRSWEPTARFARVDTCGWATGDAGVFVTRQGRVIGDASHVIVCQAGAAPTDAAKGSLDDWKRDVAALCQGNHFLLLAVSQAFTGPLLLALARPGGGFHFSGAPTTGKSILLGVAASVWGSPRGVCNWRSTNKGIESLAAAHNDQFLALDELHQMPPRMLAKAVSLLGNGQSKA